MSADFVIMAIGVVAVVLLAVWRWDERAHRAELERRRRLRRVQAGGTEDAAAMSSPILPGSLPTAAGQRLG